MQKSVSILRQAGAALGFIYGLKHGKSGGSDHWQADVRQLQHHPTLPCPSAPHHPAPPCPVLLAAHRVRGWLLACT